MTSQYQFPLTEFRPFKWINDKNKMLHNRKCDCSIVLYLPTWKTKKFFYIKNSLLLLLLSRFSRDRLCETPEMAAHQTAPSLGFSRQERWSGLPFPSPMHENEVASVMRPHGVQPTRLLRPWDFPGKSSGVGCHCLLLGKSKTCLFSYGPSKQRMKEQVYFPCTDWETTF